MHHGTDHTAPVHVTAWLTARALFRNDDGQVLLLEQAAAGGPRWSLPGGPARGEESVPVACQRRVREATGLTFVPSRVLAVHHLPAADDVAEHVTVFDGGQLAADTEIALGSGWASHRWVSREALEEFLPTPAVWEVTAALGNLDVFARFLALPAQHQSVASAAAADGTLVPGGPCLVGPAPVAL